MYRRCAAAFFTTVLATTPSGLCAARPDGTLELEVIDSETQQPIAARMVLRRGGGRALRNRDLGVARHGDHFYVDGQAELGLRRGQYTFTLEAGPEFKPVSGHFEIERRAADGKTVEMHRVVRLDEEGWRAADLLAQRSGKNLDAALRSEGVAYAPLIQWRWANDRWSEMPTAKSEEGAVVSFGPHAARRRTANGDLLFCRPEEPLTKQDLETIGDTSLDALRNAREQGLRIVAADATSWRLPVWLAAGVLDAIVVIDSSDNSQANPRERAWGRPRDKSLYRNWRGAARWREAIYFHALNAGLRVAPAAGSGTGENQLPVGSCRTYVSSFDAFTPRSWWESLEAGEAFVTNGPLLRPVVVPGRTYRLMEDTDVSVAASLTVRSRVEYLEIVKNGEVEHSVALRDLADARGRLPEIDCRGAGWFLLRAVAVDAPGYRRGMTAPYYYQPLDGEPRVSRASCEFFLEWLNVGAETLEADEAAFASRFWSERSRAANSP